MTPTGTPLFRLLGFEVRLDPSWILLALLITWTLAAGLFPSSYPDLSTRAYWWMGVASAAGIFLSIVFHELSHSVVARRYGLPITGITLFIFGGVAHMQDEPPNPKSEFLMAVAGPIASFLLALLFGAIQLMAEASGWSTSLIGVVHYLAMVNLMLGVFNLIPAFPLDGGRMLRAGLWHWKQDLRGATAIASQIGNGFGIVLMVLGGLAFLQGNFIGGMWWFLIGLFLRSAARASYGQLIVREVLQGEPIRRFMTPDPVTVSPAVTVQELVDGYVYRYHLKLFPVVEDSRLIGCISTEEIKQVPRIDWNRRTVGELVKVCSSENTISPETDTAHVLAAMARPGAPTRFMVAEAGHLCGIVSLRDLRDYIVLKMDLESKTP